ncbi:DNA (cytosine-5)-methyltransferase 1 [Bacteroides luti]|uniref:Cytosine-specific methyltransferase n=1 Tax=Bacteroides luti TaxID=1297750 RepID=A0A1M4Y123_9BACE|nr:DNA (cytosine-5-)-methyltransferase [Bacteroides luti]SHE99172.1 DNA (cytosine-5)-methyltransferase 1 [Bacteroides luti]
MKSEIRKIRFIDLFAGAGGLSEGFIRQGFEPVAHVEMDNAACNTLLTRTAYHYLKQTEQFNVYIDYLKSRITRTKLYSYLPEELKESVINLAIGKENNEQIFSRIDKLKGNEPIDLIVGGPPCQAYSLIGRAADKNKMKEDERNFLYVQYGEFLRKYQPKYFVFENVIGLLSAKADEGERYLDRLIELYREIGYETEFKILHASDFGVLQKRKRVILIGKKGMETGFYPEFVPHKSDVLVEEIFKGLPSLKAGEGNLLSTDYITHEKSGYLFDKKIRNELDFTTLHIARPNNEQDKEIYRIAVNKWNSKKERLDYNDLPDRLKTHKNRHSFFDRFKVVASDLPANHTVVAHIAKDGHYYIHPDIKQNRSLTPREAARLQSFPDDFYFEGQTEKPSRTSAFKQIGNAVPVLLAEEIAIKIKELLCQKF